MSDVTLEQIKAETDLLPPEEQQELFRYLEKKISRRHPQEWPITPQIVGTYLVKDRTQEREWLRLHRDEYASQWVALEGNRLISHGPEFKEVVAAARQAGISDPLVIYVQHSSTPPFVNL